MGAGPVQEWARKLGRGGASLGDTRVPGAFREQGAAGRGAGPEGRSSGFYLSTPGSCRRAAMALKRILSAVRSGTPSLSPLSTAPATHEQSAASPGVVQGRGEPVRPPVPTVDFNNTQEAYRSRRSWELARNLLVLRLCASRVLLAHHEQVRTRAGGWAAAR